MKKLSFLIGIGIGFLLGSRSGRGAYESVESKVREFMGQDQVQGTIDQVKTAAHDQIDNATDRVTQRVSNTMDSMSSTSPTSKAGTPS